MNLKVLGSGSSGNCYLLENETECLVIDAGLPFKEVKKAIDFNIKKISGVLVSHIHGDHFKFADEYRKTGIKVICPFETHKTVYDVGNFTIYVFQLPHNGTENYGFMIRHREIGTLLYLTDFEYCPYIFKKYKPNVIMVEANYDKDLIPQDAENFKHVLKGHCELQTTLKFISTNDNPNLKTVCLLHLSENNADSGEFIKRTKEITNKDVYVAKKGLVIDLSLEPNWAK